MILTAAMIIVVIFAAVPSRRTGSLADEMAAGSKYLRVRLGSRRARIKVSDVAGIEVNERAQRIS